MSSLLHPHIAQTFIKRLYPNKVQYYLAIKRNQKWDYLAWISRHAFTWFMLVCTISMPCRNIECMTSHIQAKPFWRHCGGSGWLAQLSLLAGRWKFYSCVVHHGIWIRLLLLNMGVTYVNSLVILGCSITGATIYFQCVVLWYCQRYCTHEKNQSSYWWESLCSQWWHHFGQ